MIKVDIIEKIALELNIEPALIYATTLTESNGKFSIGNGKIPILYERHWAYKFAKRQFGLLTAIRLKRKHPDIINNKWGGYTKNEYKRLAKAIKVFSLEANKTKNLQEAAIIGNEIAHLSTSFGAFQIMGFNYRYCGYDSAKDMSDAYHKKPIEEQIKGFINFIKNYKKGKVLEALKVKNWKKAAYLYNGSAYKRNNYDKKLATAYYSYNQKIA